VLLLAVMLLAAEPEEIAPFDPASRGRITLALSGGLSPNGGEVGGAVEVGLMALRFVRLQLDAGADYAASSGDHGIVRLLAGVDGVLPLPKSELFVGIETGFTHTNFSYLRYGGPPCFDCFYPSNPWQWGPALRVRSGFDLFFWRPFVLGASIAYSYIAVSQYENYSFGEIALRLGAVF
jgi:hypothetical protein